MINTSSFYDGIDGIKINDSKHVEIFLLGVSPKMEAIAEDACRVCHYINFVNHDLCYLSLKTLIYFVYLEEKEDKFVEERWKKAYNHDFSDLEILFISYEEYSKIIANKSVDPNIIINNFDSRIDSKHASLITETELTISSMLSEIDSNKRSTEYYNSLAKHWCSRFRSAQPSGQILDWKGFKQWILNNEVCWNSLEHNRWMAEAIQRGFEPLTEDQSNAIDSIIKSDNLSSEEKKKEFIALKDSFKKVNYHVDLCSFATLQQRDPDSIILDQVHNDKYLIQRIYEFYFKFEIQ